MRSQKPLGTSEMKPVDDKASMKDMWAAAAKAFENICGESLHKGEVKSFDDVQRKIEISGRVSVSKDAESENNWSTMAKNVGLKSLKYLRMFVGAASQASSLIPMPTAAASITGTALCFIFDIPQAIKGYNDAINEVFDEVSSALSQFQIYRSMENVDPLLIQQTHLVLISFVKLCAHMAGFKQALQGQRDVRGTVMLAVVETHKGVQALKDESDRTKTLVKIREVLGVPTTVRLDTNTTQTCTNISDKCLDSKTSASTLITKRLEKQRGRTYVAHYFFPPSAKKSADDKNPVQSALEYMAFQIARVDATVKKALGKACDAGPTAFRRSMGPEDLDTLLTELKIGVPGSSATYYIPAGGSARRVRILASGTNDQFDNEQGVDNALRIKMNEYNGPNMRTVIDEVLRKQGMLQNVQTNSEQQKVKDKIIEKLPQKVKGSYSLLQLGLDNVIHLLSTRTAVQEFDRILDQSMSSHKAAIENMQRSLMAGEIDELNELLKRITLGNIYLSLEQLEAVMWLFSGIASLTSLEYIIKNKYLAVLKLEDGYMDVQYGAREYLQKKKESASRPSRFKDRGTLSMTVTINNVDQELCGQFIWDLADMASRDKFKFNFNGDTSNALHSSSQAPSVWTNWLPYHLGRVREPEDDDKGALTPHEQYEIGQSLYELFKDNVVLKRHKATFEQAVWTVADMKDVQEWLMDSAVGFWSWEVEDAYCWLKEFMTADEEKLRQLYKPTDTNFDDPSSNNSSSPPSASSDSELDSLRYERLAEASSWLGYDHDRTQSLYQRAIEQNDFSWLCRRSLEATFYRQNRSAEAIAQVELALKEAEHDNATPKPCAKDIIDLHLLLGRYAYDAGDMPYAAEHYSFGVKPATRSKQYGDV
ncbi:hypothetical protein F4809DRAFT_646823 [Biscogniauxia mediterranea]|nr:hypothetical protein F4809DRAFT_646823 [Biscogniauxia mediterranea]